MSSVGCVAVVVVEAADVVVVLDVVGRVALVVVTAVGE